MAQSLLSYAVTCLQMQANSHKPVAQYCTEGKYKAVDLQVSCIYIIAQNEQQVF